MAFRGVTYDQQIVKSKNDGAFYRGIFPTDGIICGCEMEISSNAVTIQPGLLIVCGRHIWNDGVETIRFDNLIQNGYGRIRVRTDLNQPATQTEFEQIENLVDYQTTSLFPELRQEDINDTGLIYEQELAVVKIEAGNVTAITRKIGNAEIDAAKFGGQFPAYYAKETEAFKKTGGIISGDVQINRYPNSNFTLVGYSGSLNAQLLSGSSLHIQHVDSIQCTKYSDISKYIPVYAAAFHQSSSVAVKENIEEYSGALEQINSTKIFEYTRNDSGAQQIGLIVEDATTPQDLIVESPAEPKVAKARAAASKEPSKFIDLYSFISMTAQAVKELKEEKDAEIAELRNTVSDLAARLEAALKQ